MSLGLKLECTNGHVQVIRTEGFSRQQIEEWGALMDGTSKFFAHPVQDEEDTFIGHCGICNARTKSSCVELDEDDKPSSEAVRYPDGSTSIREL